MEQSNSNQCNDEIMLLDSNADHIEITSLPLPSHMDSDIAMPIDSECEHLCDSILSVNSSNHSYMDKHGGAITFSNGSNKSGSLRGHTHHHHPHHREHIMTYDEHLTEPSPSKMMGFPNYPETPEKLIEIMDIESMDEDVSLYGGNSTQASPTPCSPNSCMDIGLLSPEENSQSQFNCYALPSDENNLTTNILSSVDMDEQNSRDSGYGTTVSESCHTFFLQSRRQNNILVNLPSKCHALSETLNQYIGQITRTNSLTSSGGESAIDIDDPALRLMVGDNNDNGLPNKNDQMISKLVQEQPQPNQLLEKSPIPTTNNEIDLFMDNSMNAPSTPPGQQLLLSPLVTLSTIATQQQQQHSVGKSISCFGSSNKYSLYSSKCKPFSCSPTDSLNSIDDMDDNLELIDMENELLPNDFQSIIHKDIKCSKPPAAPSTTTTTTTIKPFTPKNIHSNVRRCLSLNDSNSIQYDDQQQQYKSPISSIINNNNKSPNISQLLNLTPLSGGGGINSSGSKNAFKRPDPLYINCPLQTKRYKINDDENNDKENIGNIINNNHNNNNNKSIMNNNNNNNNFNINRPKFRKSVSMIDTSNIMNALARSSSNPDLIGDFSKPFCLPLMEGKHCDLKSISCHTLAKLINGEYLDSVESFKIVDCRYPYEYDGGHIVGAKNFYTHNQIIDEFYNLKMCSNSLTTSTAAAAAAATTTTFPTVSSNKTTTTTTILDSSANTGGELITDDIMNNRNILVFHCEFSSERGPKLSRFLRKHDRLQNTNVYPSLNYPEIYLLHGGYKEFFENYNDLCCPNNYRPMLDPLYGKEYRHFRTKSKSWNGGENLSRTLSSSSASSASSSSSSPFEIHSNKYNCTTTSNNNSSIKQTVFYRSHSLKNSTQHCTMNNESNNIGGGGGGEGGGGTTGGGVGGSSINGGGGGGSNGGGGTRIVKTRSLLL